MVLYSVDFTSERFTRERFGQVFGYARALPNTA